MGPWKLLGLRIKVLRFATGLGPNELAEKAGISLSTLSRLENGRPICTENLEFVAEALGVTVESLMKDISD